VEQVERMVTVTSQYVGTRERRGTKAQVLLVFLFRGAFAKIEKSDC